MSEKAFKPLEEMNPSAQMSFMYLHPELLGTRPRPVDTNMAKQELRNCYDKICEQISFYMDLPEEKIKLISNIIIATYFHGEFNTFPIVFLNAMKGSGKTRLLKIISSLSAGGDGSIISQPTEATLFRRPKGRTVCIDEIENIGAKEKGTIREIINTVYKKGNKIERMKKVKKNNEETQEVESFTPYYPLFLANIWGIEEVLADRSITLVLEKSADPKITKLIEDFDENEEFKEIKRTLERVSVVSVMTLHKKTYKTAWNNYIKYNNISTHTTLTTLNNTNSTNEQTLESLDLECFFDKIDGLGISGRNLEIIWPLLMTAKEIGEDVFEEILKISSDMVNEKKDDEYQDSKDVMVYEFVKSKQSAGLQLLSIKQLVSEFRTYIGEADNIDQWLNEKWFGRSLKRLNLVTSKKRMPSGRFVILNYAKACEKLKIFKSEEEE